ncbi:hypothetical protein FACS189452_09770 [Bacteroidia bacterium]|nr:hypothetical protein FACS189452_09770 [Bacteroidia bacterium]GHT80188.1 hypothetical protein FACS189467_1710 [Bacteroidia bacterium]
MITTDINQLRIIANKREYERLRADANYTNVKFNDKTGGLLAIHKDHCFDPTIGRFEIPRGDYERIASEVLFNYGHSIILNSEKLARGLSAPEGKLDGKFFDIKGVEGIGKRNLIDKISNASKQGAETVVFYYPDISIFDRQNIRNAYNGYLKLSKNEKIQIVYYIVDKKLYKLT